MPTVPFSSCRTARYFQQSVCRQFPFLPEELHAISSTVETCSYIFNARDCIKHHLVPFLLMWLTLHLVLRYELVAALFDRVLLLGSSVKELSFVNCTAA